MSTYHLPGFSMTDHEFSIPLDHEQPDGEQITVYAREVVAAAQVDNDLPWLIFLQGGPGSPSPRPEDTSGWLGMALQHYRVLLLDQRGTGRSTPLTVQTLARFDSTQAQADYLTHFRADSIVRDAELIRRQLLGADRRWTLLGQSYGGFCIGTYLSFAPEGVEAAMITGGLAPIGQPVDDVYRHTYRRVIEQNRRYFQRYPDDAGRLREIVDYLRSHEVELPGGGLLTPRRFLQLGLALGSGNGYEQIHYLLEEAFVEGPSGREISYALMRGVEHAQHYETNPIFALLHEAIYMEGAASNWSAERIRAEFPEFSLDAESPLFTGEMIYPWMFDDYKDLRPLKEAAEILAATDDWPALYDTTVLAQNSVPVVATIYYDDMYVDAIFAEQTASLIQGTRYWLTNELVHSALRMDGEKVFGRLTAMLRGEV